MHNLRILGSLVFLFACIGLSAAPVKANLAGKHFSYTSGNNMPYDAEVEYIEAKSVGPAFILPAIPQTCTFDFRLKIYCAAGGYANYFGCRINGNGSFLQFLPHHMILDYPTKTWYRRVTASGGTYKWLDWKVEGNILSLNDEVIKDNFNNSVNFGWIPSGVGVFGTVDDNYGINNKSYGRVSFVSYSVDGVLVFDGIPVRFRNEQGVQEGALYDKVSGELFRNRGTGTFTIGPDVK